MVWAAFYYFREPAILTLLGHFNVKGNGGVSTYMHAGFNGWGFDQEIDAWSLFIVLIWKFADILFERRLSLDIEYWVLFLLESLV